MFPAFLYELLPYIYLTVGAVGYAVFESSLILMASALIILAGFIVLWMRIDYRRKSRNGGVVNIHFDNRSNSDRRKNHFAVFPLVDGLGNLIEENRRSGERRQSA